MALNDFFLIKKWTVLQYFGNSLYVHKYRNNEFFEFCCSKICFVNCWLSNSSTKILQWRNSWAKHFCDITILISVNFYYMIPSFDYCNKIVIFLIIIYHNTAALKPPLSLTFFWKTNQKNTDKLLRMSFYKTNILYLIVLNSSGFIRRQKW